MYSPERGTERRAGAGATSRLLSRSLRHPTGYRRRRGAVRPGESASKGVVAQLAQERAGGLSSHVSSERFTGRNPNSGQAIAKWSMLASGFSC